MKPAVNNNIYHNQVEDIDHFDTVELVSVCNLIT